MKVKEAIATNSMKKRQRYIEKLIRKYFFPLYNTVQNNICNFYNIILAINLSNGGRISHERDPGVTPVFVFFVYALTCFLVIRTKYQNKLSLRNALLTKINRKNTHVLFFTLFLQLRLKLVFYLRKSIYLVGFLLRLIMSTEHISLH